mgnify:CR=1 FL=1
MKERIDDRYEGVGQSEKWRRWMKVGWKRGKYEMREIEE